MATRTLAATIGAALVGLVGIAATATPAAADGFSFGIRIGEPGGGAYYGAYHDGYGVPVYREVHRPRWDHRRPVKVCEPVWTTRKYVDHRGRVYKVVKVQQESCRWVGRNR